MPSGSGVHDVAGRQPRDGDRRRWRARGARRACTSARCCRCRTRSRSRRARRSPRCSSRRTTRCTGSSTCGIGERVLVHAIGSGVGTAALQLARHRRRDGVRHVALGGEARAREVARPRARDRHVVARLGGAPRGARRHERDPRRDGSRRRRLPARQSARARAARAACASIGLTAGNRSEIDLGVVLRKRLKIIGTALRSRTPEEKAAARARVRAAHRAAVRRRPTASGDRARVPVRGDRRRTCGAGVERDVREAGVEVVNAATSLRSSSPCRARSRPACCLQRRDQTGRKASRPESDPPDQSLLAFRDERLRREVGDLARRNGSRRRRRCRCR